MFPDMAASISPSVGLGLAASNAVADMIWPDWQYPHCGTSSSIQACWIFLPAGVAPMASIVVMRLPAAAETGVMQERTGLPSRWIVHAPHKARPQPNFVPVIPSTSRSTQSNGVSSSTSTLRALPLIVSVCGICRSSKGFLLLGWHGRPPQNLGPPCRVCVVRFLLRVNRHGRSPLDLRDIRARHDARAVREMASPEKSTIAIVPDDRSYRNIWASKMVGQPPF